MNSVITWLAIGGGLGTAPILAGTLGALPGLLLVWVLVRRSRRLQLWGAALLVGLAVPLCEVADHTLGGEDDRRIVADEYLAFPVAVAGQKFARSPWVLGIAFVMSRLLDAIKPFPAAQLEAVAGGPGIVLDDLAANLYAWLLLAAGTAAWRQWQRHKQCQR